MTALKSFSRKSLNLVASGALGIAVSGAMITASSPAQANDRSLAATYSVMLNGLKLGQGGFSAAMKGSAYTIKGTSSLSGLVGALVKFQAAGTANGQFSGSGHRPSGFAATSVSSKKTSTVQIAMAGGNVSKVAIAPPVSELGKVPLTGAHRKNVVDPMSAMVLPMAAGGAADPSNCSRTIRIFNGRERFDVALSYKRMAKIDSGLIGGVTNQATVCQARYQPIAGHRAGREEVEFFKNERGIELWLVPAGATGFMVPYRIAVPTPIGQGVVQMTGLTALGKSRVAAR